MGYDMTKNCLLHHLCCSWEDAWHLHPADNHSKTMNIYSAWNMGVTGRGVKVVHIDDGIDYRHRDLRYNFYKKSKSVKHQAPS